MPRPNRVYRAAVIGCGRIASGFDSDPKRAYVATHAGAYMRSKRAVLAAVCDRDASALKACLARWGITQGYRDHKALLAAERPDVVSICTPPHTHLAVIRDALACGSVRAIFCEKPLSDSSKGAAAVVRACERKGVVLQIGHQRRFDPLHRQLREKLAAGAFGAPQRAVFHYTAGLENTGTHMFDLLCYFFGRPVWVSAVPSTNPSHKAGDENLDGMVRFESGLTVQFGACDVKQYLVFELDCFCREARFMLTSSGFDLRFFKKGPSPHFTGYEELLAARPPVPVRYRRNFMVNAVEHLLDCLDGNTATASSGWDGLMAVRMIEAARRSAKRKGITVAI